MTEIEILHVWGSTVKIEDTIRDFSDPLQRYDPDTLTWKIYDPDKELQETITPTRVSLEVYYAYYTIPSYGKEGTWIVESTVTKGEWTT
jgi:hypothetical protein